MDENVTMEDGSERDVEMLPSLKMEEECHESMSVGRPLEVGKAKETYFFINLQKDHSPASILIFDPERCLLDF